MAITRNNNNISNLNEYVAGNSEAEASDNDDQGELETAQPIEAEIPAEYFQLVKKIRNALKNKMNYASLIPELSEYLGTNQFLIVKDIALGNKNSSEYSDERMGELYNIPGLLQLLFELEARVKENRFNNSTKNQKKIRYKDLTLDKWSSTKGLSPKTYLDELVKQMVAQELTDETCYGRTLYLSCDRDGRSVLDGLNYEQQEDWTLVKKVFVEHYGVEDFIFFNIRLLTDVPQDQNVHNVVNNLISFIAAVHELAIDVGEPHIFVNALMLRRIPDDVRKNVLTVMQARRQTINLIQIQKLRKLIVTKAKEIIKEKSNTNNNINSNSKNNNNNKNNNNSNMNNNNSNMNNNNSNKSNNENPVKRFNNYGIKRLDAKKGDCYNCGAPNFNKDHRCNKDNKGVIQLHPDYVKSAGLNSLGTK